MAEHIQVFNPIGGQPYGISPTPKTSDGLIDIDDSSNKIATTEWVKSSLNKVSGKNVGDEWHSFTGRIPAGGVPYCGQTVTRATYADLWNYVQEQGLVKTEDEWHELNTSQKGNVPFYSYGDGSTTFRMPKVVGYIKGVASVDDSGSYTAEGLPNITGHVHGISEELKQNGEANPSWIGGAFAMNWQNGYSYTSSDASTVGGFDFNASLSNPIYGNSTHVTPETTTVLFGVYAFGELTVTGSTTTDALATGLATVEAEINRRVLTVNGNSPDPTGNVYRTFTVVDRELCNGDAGIAGTYDLGFPNDKIRIGVFTCTLQTSVEGSSKMELGSDVMPCGGIAVATNNGFISSSIATIPFRQSIILRFTEVYGGVISGTLVHFEGYFD